MTIEYFVTSQKVREDIGAMRLYLNFLRCYIIFVYFVPFCGYINLQSPNENLQSKLLSYDFQETFPVGP